MTDKPQTSFSLDTFLSLYHIFQMCPLNPSQEKSENNTNWEEFSECFTPAIQNIVNFAKCIPGFQVLTQEDQVTLLKVNQLSAYFPSSQINVVQACLQVQCRWSVNVLYQPRRLGWRWMGIIGWNIPSCIIKLIYI
jgi:hypothetical protein